MYLDWNDIVQALGVAGAPSHTPTSTQLRYFFIPVFIKGSRVQYPDRSFVLFCLSRGCVVSIL